MKSLFFFICGLAAVSAVYYGPQHIPVIGPHGVPIEPIEVQAARANHLAALASAHGGGYYGRLSLGVPTLSHNAIPLDTPVVAAAKVQHYRDYAVAAQRNGVHVPLPVAPILGGHYPADTPEVQIAKAAHFQAHAEARSRGLHYRKRRDIYGGYHIPVIGPGGVPVEPPEVQAARANHLAAHGKANYGPAAYTAGPTVHAVPTPYSEPYHRYYGPPATIGPDGQPIETPEVKAAKAYHFAAHAAVQSGAGYLAGPGHYY